MKALLTILGLITASLQTGRRGRSSKEYNMQIEGEGLIVWYHPHILQENQLLK